MSLLSIPTEGIQIQFFCDNCNNEDSDEDSDNNNSMSADSEVLAFYQFERQGAPQCQVCDEPMISDYLLISPDEPAPRNNI